MKKILLSFLFILSYHFAFAQAQDAYHPCIPDLPKPQRLVNDFAHILSAQEEINLESKLIDYEKETSNEFTFVSMPNTCEVEPERFTNELGRKWGIGKAKKKNGVLVFVALETRKIFIKPAEGIQGALTDGFCGSVIRKYMVPAFKSGDYAKGINEAFDALMAKSKGEFVNDEPEEPGGSLLFLLIILFFLFLIILFIFRNRKDIYISRRGWKYDSDTWGSFPRSGGGWIGGGGWSGGGGSSGGGGFGGFGGGGGWNGGGAGGSW